MSGNTNNGPPFSPSPQGIHSFHRWVETVRDNRAVQNQYEGRFDTAALAWIVTGMNSDGRHLPDAGSFHQDTLRVRRETMSSQNNTSALRKVWKERLMDLLFDVVRYRHPFDLL